MLPHPHNSDCGLIFTSTLVTFPYIGITVIVCSLFVSVVAVEAIQIEQWEQCWHLGPSITGNNIIVTNISYCTTSIHIRPNNIITAVKYSPHGTDTLPSHKFAKKSGITHCLKKYGDLKRCVLASRHTLQIQADRTVRGGWISTRPDGKPREVCSNATRCSTTLSYWAKWRQRIRGNKAIPCAQLRIN